MKAEVDYLDMNKLVIVPNSLNNLKTKVDQLGDDKLENTPKYLKKISDVVSKGVVENTTFNTLKAKVNKLDKETLDATTLIHIIQYNVGDVDKKIPDVSSLVTTTF